MDFVIDLFMEIVFDVFVEGFLSLWFWLFSGRRITEKGKRVVKVICTIVSLAFLTALIGGITLLFSCQGKNLWGWLLVSLGAVYVVSGVVLKVVSYMKSK